MTAADLRRHDTGRTQRLPIDPLRQLHGTVDGERCRCPGCTRHRRLHADYIRFWQAGGSIFDDLICRNYPPAESACSVACRWV